MRMNKHKVMTITMIIIILKRITANIILLNVI